jgi:hypothetical protein
LVRRSLSSRPDLASANCLRSPHRRGHPQQLSKCRSFESLHLSDQSLPGSSLPLPPPPSLPLSPLTHSHPPSELTNAYSEILCGEFSSRRHPRQWQQPEHPWRHHEVAHPSHLSLCSLTLLCTASPQIGSLTSSREREQPQLGSRANQRAMGRPVKGQGRRVASQ